MREIENHHEVNTKVTIVLGYIPRMLRLVGESLRRKRMLGWFQNISPEIFINYKRKNSNCSAEKPIGHYVNQIAKVNVAAEKTRCYPAPSEDAAAFLLFLPEVEGKKEIVYGTLEKSIPTGSCKAKGRNNCIQIPCSS